MRPVLAAFTCALLLGAPLGLSACGGDDRPYDQVPATTPELIPPDDANDIASGSGTGTTTQSSGTTGAQGTTPSTGGTTATPAPSTGGATATPTPTPTPTPDTGGGTAPDTGGAAPDTGGVSPDDSAAAGSVQQFCADNPGAC